MIYFRCDGNSFVGGGHVMRCLSIAREIKKNGYECCFILSDDEFKSSIEQYDIKSIVLNSLYNDMNSELDKLNIIGKNNTIVVDSYYVTSEYLSTLRMDNYIIYIDDLMAFPYPVDIIVNYNIYATQEKYEKLYLNNREIKPRFLLGTKYVPLRNEFAAVNEKVVNDEIVNVFVSTGASDTYHMALNLIKDILKDGTNYIYHFLIGSKNKDVNDIIEMTNSNKNIKVYYNYDKVCNLMQLCDVAISAAGSTLYELCRVGLPILGFISADNQIAGINEFCEKGMLINLGDIRQKRITLNLIEKKLNEMQNKNQRKKISLLNQSIVDGNGAKELAFAIININK